MKDYKRILQGVVNIINITKKSDIGFANICTYIGENCPELKESEDERIRKDMMETIEKESKDFPSSVIAEKSHTWLAWLEKQGEKSVDKLQVSSELYEHIRNTCACIDDALSSETIADINDYLSMAERSAKSAFDMIEKQGEQKPAENKGMNLAEEDMTPFQKKCSV